MIHRSAWVMWSVVCLVAWTLAAWVPTPMALGQPPRKTEASAGEASAGKTSDGKTFAGETFHGEKQAGKFTGGLAAANIPRELITQNEARDDGDEDDDEQPLPPALTAAARMLPGDAVLYFGWDGTASHPSWNETACKKAFVDSGLYELLSKVVSELETNTPFGQRKLLSSAMDFIPEHGFHLTLTLSDGAFIPWAMIVLPQAQSGVSRIDEILKASGAPGDVKVVSLRNRGIHKFSAPQLQADVGWWVEGNSIVIAAGPDAFSSAIDCIEGKRSRLLDSRIFRSLNEQSEGDVVSRSFFNMAAVRERFGTVAIPIPTHPGEPLPTVDEFLTLTGLDKANLITGVMAFKGSAIVRTSVVEGTPPFHGLLAGLSARPFTLDELPSLPPTPLSITAMRCDLQSLWNGFFETLNRIAGRVNERDLREAIARANDARQWAGMDVARELLAPLGDLLVMYSEPGSGILGVDFNLVVKLRDADKASDGLRKLIDRVCRLASGVSRAEVKPVTRTRNGCLVTTVSSPIEAFVAPSFVIVDDWLHLGLNPQACHLFVMRSKDSLPKWTPDKEMTGILSTFPKEMTSFGMVDPRPGVRGALWFVSLMIGGARMAAVAPNAGNSPFPNLSLSVSDIPPADVITAPLFPNVSMSVPTRNGMKWISRESLPGSMFGFGGDPSSSIGTSSVLVALLLPAVQKARIAARRTQSLNNMRQLALAIHNYESTTGRLPSSHDADVRLEPTERVGWMARILPFVEQQAVHDRIDFRSRFDSEANKPMLAVRIRSFENPLISLPDELVGGMGRTDYVGITGVGHETVLDAKVTRKSGIFGLNRHTRFRDVLDGTSNTMMVMEANGEPAAWGDPVRSVRALTAQPYLNGPDGLGSLPTGCHVLMADGSVRFISVNTDPSVMEAMATMAGGEVIAIP